MWGSTNKDRSNFDDLHILFDKTHVSGASPWCPRDIPTDESNDDDVVWGKRSHFYDDVKLGSLKNSKQRKKNAEYSGATQEKDEKTPS